MDAVKVHQIHVLAGQRNESAVHYHFGSRRNLLNAILEEGDLRRVQASAEVGGSSTSAKALLRGLTRSLASGLRTPEGRDWLRIISQLMTRYPMVESSSTLAGGPDETVRRMQAVLPWLPAEVVERRTMIVLRFLTDQIAERARRLDDARPRGMPLDDEEFLDELVDTCDAMLTIASRSPGRAVPDGSSQDERRAAPAQRAGTKTMTEGVEAIAEAMRSELDGGNVGKVISSHLADTFEMHHHPAMPTDGVVERAAMLKATSGGADPAAGGVRTMESVAVTGERIAVTSLLVVTPPDGQEVRIRNTAYYTVSGERIVRIDSHYDDDAVAAMARLRQG